MAAPRALTLVIGVAIAACSNGPLLTPSPLPAATAAPTPTGPTPSSTPAPSPLTSPSAGLDPATSIQIAPPYELEQPSPSDLDLLSGNIQGLPSDLAESAGAGYAPSDFPMGVRFIVDDRRSVGKTVGAVVVLAMPSAVAEEPGLLESVAAAVAAEVNAVLSFETIDGVKVGVVKGPIASALAIVDGHLVMAQSGQPAVHPKDLMAAVIAANGAGLAGAALPNE